jgi:hypothetical protein
MGFCETTSEDLCPGFHCTGLEKCFVCHDCCIGDTADTDSYACAVPSETLFFAIIFPLMVFFAILGVYILHRSRISTRSDRRHTIWYLVVEIAAFLDLYFFLMIAYGNSGAQLAGFFLGPLTFLVGTCLLCCWGCGVGKRQQPQQQPQPLNMGVVVVPDPSVRFHAPPVVMGEPAPTPVVPGYPVSGGGAPVIVAVAPSSQMLHGDTGGYHPPVISASATAVDIGAPPSAPIKEAFHV